MSIRIGILGYGNLGRDRGEVPERRLFSDPGSDVPD